MLKWWGHFTSDAQVRCFMHCNASAAVAAASASARGMGERVYCDRIQRHAQVRLCRDFALGRGAGPHAVMLLSCCTRSGACELRVVPYNNQSQLESFNIYTTQCVRLGLEGSRRHGSQATPPFADSAGSKIAPSAPPMCSSIPSPLLLLLPLLRRLLLLLPA
eukprot:GHRQ01013669.1.p1 GENE.GHRQ01013669.1~~GHRQ01013669.1.p1  ORF type:complete len:162 (+),score=31.62 GHRQ01013669.1:405-890(+)